MTALHRRSLPLIVLFAILLCGQVPGQHRLLIQGKGRLAVVDESGKLEWEMPWGPVHDMHLLANGHILVQQGPAAVAEIDPTTKQVLWTYDSAKNAEKAGARVEVHAFQPLEDERLMIAESGTARIIEIGRDGSVLKRIPLRVLRPNPHTDTRLARKLASGNYLVCHEADGVVREYDGQSSKVIWEYSVPLFGESPKPGHGPDAFGNKCFAALRLPNGNTLVSTGNGHSVLEVTADKKIVRQIRQRDLPGIVLAWVTTLELLPNGHWVIGNCHAGPGQPQVIEVNPESLSVVWSFEQFEVFGNDVSNTVVLGAGFQPKAKVR